MLEADALQGIVQLDLTTGEETPLVEPTEDLGRLSALQPLPAGGEGRGGTLREYQRLAADGLPEALVVAHVADDGTAHPLFSPRPEDALLQTCVSPSGRYVAALVAPHIVTNAYDAALASLPRELETHVIEVASGDEVSVLPGFDISWCTVAPS